MILEQESIDVFPGPDVGKTSYHAVALNRIGKKLYDKALPQDETETRGVITGLAAHEEVLVVLDQPAFVGALPVAVAEPAHSVPHTMRSLVHRILSKQEKAKTRDKGSNGINGATA